MINGEFYLNGQILVWIMWVLPTIIKLEMEYMFTIKRTPTTPGEILRNEFLSELGISQKQLADHIGCDVKVINRIVNNRASVTAVMAVKLSSALNTSAQFWLNAQQAVDIYWAIKKIKSFPSPITKAS
jgi:addiction module HigA family antidote